MNKNRFSKASAIRMMTATIMLISTIGAWGGEPDQWHPTDNPLMTKWAEAVTPEKVLNEYPRPQMRRDQWKNLNGLWKYSIVPLLKGKPDKWDGNILVPFPVESALSGVGKRVGPDNRLWYTRTFTIPEAWKDQRVLIHFGAVDWKSEVFVNGSRLGTHEGGYTAFTYDMTNVLKEDGKQEVTVAVWDPTDDGFQPRGKQVRDPKGIFYTPATGIWQTVWLEPVPRTAIRSLDMVADIDNAVLKLKVDLDGPTEGHKIKAVAYSNGKVVSQAEGSWNRDLELEIEEMELWSPENPHLYDLVVSLDDDHGQTDEVESYFGMRKISLGTADDGYVRLFLNNEPLFHFGLLDQGYWPDGIYTAPTDEALKYDIEVTRKLGYNMIRKHVKVEPARWYYWTDKLGLLVWQDMPNGDKRFKRGGEDIQRVAQSEYAFKKELKEMIEQLDNHPSIVVWVPFNEGWGQFKTAEIAGLTKELDPTRLADVPSGWQDRGVGDMHDIHSYPGPDMPPTEEDRAAILGEYGGQALVVKDHLWVSDFSKAPSHYKTSQSRETLHDTYYELLDKVKALKDKGLAGAIYTQTTDVEAEVNGVMTYDREEIKFDEARMREAHQNLIQGD